MSETLKERAKRLSKFLLLDKGDSVLVQYVGWKGAVDPKDPTKEVTIYEFREAGIQKFWTNSSGKVMRALAMASPMEWVRITRERATKADGTEDETKSNYVVEVIGDRPPAEGALPPTPGSIVPPTPQRTQINGNPGGVVDPANIADPFDQ